MFSHFFSKFPPLFFLLMGEYLIVFVLLIMKLKLLTSLINECVFKNFFTVSFIIFCSMLKLEQN